MKPIHYLVAFVTLNHTAMAATRVGVPLYAIHLDASPMVVGVLVGLFAIVPALASVAIGRVVDRVGTRLPLITCLPLMVAGMLLPYLWPDEVAPMFVAALVVGGSYFSVFIIQTTLAGYYAKAEERIGNFSLISLGSAAGNGLGPLVVGFSMDHAGYSLTFLLLALLPLIASAILLAGMLPQRGPQRMPAKDVARKSVMDLMRGPRLFPIYMISFCSVLMWDIFTVMTPLYGAELKLSPSAIGVIMGIFSAASLIVRTLLPPLGRHFRPLQLLLISQAVGAVALLGFGLVSAVPLLVAVAFVVGMAQGIGGPTVTSALYEAAPPDRVSEAAGLRLSVGTACQAAMPLATGALASVMGVASMYWLTAGVLMFGVWQYRAQWHVDLRSASDDSASPKDV